MRLSILILTLHLIASPLFAQLDTAATTRDSITRQNNTIIATNDTLLATLKIVIKGFRSYKGNVLIALSDRLSNFLTGEPVRKMSTPVTGSQVMLVFDSIGKGNYALAVIHDENYDGIMNTNDFNIPTEGYAFSNDARGILGPPDFRAALFRFSAEKDRTLVITMFYTNAK